MAIPATIVLADAETVPVNHTFTPIQDGPEAKYINSAGATILASQETLAVEVSRGKTDESPSKGRVVLWDPKEGTVDSKTVVLYGNSGSANFTFAPAATVQEKKNVMKMLVQACSNPDIIVAVTEGKPFI